MARVTLPTTRFTVEEFQRMVDADVFGTERVELINGRIWRMAPQLDPHMVTIAKCVKALAPVVPDQESLFVPGTLRLDPFTVVDPDLMWVAAPLGTPEHLRPLPLLLIEVSHATYRKDSGVKLRNYARAMIGDYWILN